MLVSATHQSKSAICIHVSSPWTSVKLPTSFLNRSVQSVQSLSHVQLFATPWTAVCQASLSITDSWSLLRLMSVEPVMPSILNRYTVYIRQSSSPSLSHPPLCLCFHLPVLYNWVSILALQTSSSLPSFWIPPTCININICFSLSDLPHSVWQTPGPSISLNDPVSFLFMTDIPSLYMYHIFFIHSSVNGHLGCFHVPRQNWHLSLLGALGALIPTYVEMGWFDFLFSWLCFTSSRGKIVSQETKQDDTVYESEWKWSHSVVSDSLWPHGL